MFCANDIKYKNICQQTGFVSSLSSDEFLRLQSNGAIRRDVMCLEEC